MVLGLAPTFVVLGASHDLNYFNIHKLVIVDFVAIITYVIHIYVYCL